MNDGFIKVFRSAEQLAAKAPNAFRLAFFIASRARFQVDVYNPHELQIGEAMIGDHASIGMTRQEYRTARETLARRQIATFRATNTGTIAKLCDSTYFGCHNEPEQPPKQPASNQQPTSKQPLTKKERKKEEEKKPEKPPAPAAPVGFQEFIDGWCSAYPAAFGNSYRFTGARDGKAVKDLLIAKLPVPELLTVAKNAWAAYRENPKLFACGQAADIPSFYTYFNKIRAELSTYDKANKSDRVSATSLTKGTINEEFAGQYAGVGRLVPVQNDGRPST